MNWINVNRMTPEPFVSDGCGGIVMCNYCQTPIYIKTIQYCKSLLAPLTPEQELRDKLLDMTGEVYVNIPKKYCPFCGAKMDLED